MSWPIALGKYMTALHVWTDKKAVQSMKWGGGIRRYKTATRDKSSLLNKLSVTD